ncbi:MULTISPECIES: glycosyltransferase family 39 protein [Cyanophyceae]|uniref:ArnT family glycosyltransferase n=1 Tax=Cyanophyceae TaxID=3028117 RepID=UPI00016DCDA2|nr:MULTISPECIES: glycosyltransferase family 39 protein [Cyanophyceae]ACB00522.1 Dolichyl-phosphate-mannose-protein mannosyltransferase family [Picosynechococcus sp. PCC 7002]SMH50045.1 4-amino-4-deoxy-L-arabinose transferase [Picosynechococcus sp. OG1]SMQ81730.1 4-amino-4-deoxy-L-arabinose transferase [Synechococcus sp. 7002]
MSHSKRRWEDWGQTLGDRQIILGLSLAALFLFCLNLGNMPLRDWDEGTRALVAREIFRTGNWLHPTQFGDPYLLKPPLMDWLVASSYTLGGVNEWTSRLPGAVGSALGVPLLYCLGRQLFQGRSPALWSVLVYLTLLPVVRHGRLLMLDGLVLTALIFSLWCLLKAQKSPIWGLGFGLGLGIIAFVKGLLMLPLGAIALLFVIWDRRWFIFKNLYIWLGLGLGACPVLLWYGAQIQHYGATFIQVHFFNQGFDRVASTVESHQEPPWFYLLEIAKYTAPWLFFLPQSYQYLWQIRQTSSSRLILTGSIFYLGLISAMGTKLPWYVMPIYPFLALALGHYLAKLWDAPPRKAMFLRGLFGLLAIAALGGGIYLYFTDPQVPLILMALTLGGMFAVTTWLWPRPQALYILVGGMYCGLALLFCSQAWVWEINEAFPVKPIAAIIRAETPADAIIFTTFDYSRPSLDFYGDRPVRPQPLEAPVGEQYWLIHQDLLTEQPALKEALPPFELLGRASGFNLVHFFPD